MSYQPTIYFLMGPTACGKTALSLELAKEFPIEIVSVDSSMVYRGMNIGTGKPTSAELQSAPHHLIDIRAPDEPYSVGEFCNDAMMSIRHILQEGRIPLLVGGTMLYFHALQFGLSDLPSANIEIRDKIDQEINESGLERAYQRLQSIDMDYAKKIQPTDKQRIQRALEVFEISERPLSSFFAQKTSFLDDFHVKVWALAPGNRTVIHDNIAQRFYQMLENGLITEVEQLKHLSIHLPSMRSVGYRQVLSYLHGACDYQQMVNQAIVATRQLAKRQLTWLRSWPELEWLPYEEPSLIMNMGHFFSKDI